MKGHQAGDDKSTAMLFDLYNENPLLSAYANVQKAEEMITILKPKRSTPAKARQKLDCFSNRKMDLYKLLILDCRPVCNWVKSELTKNKLEKQIQT